MKREMRFYFHLAKCSYLKSSDKCSKIFCLVVKRNKKRDYIAAILKEDGILTTSRKQATNEFKNFYGTLLSTSSQVRPIDLSITRAGAVVSME